MYQQKEFPDTSPFLAAIVSLFLPTFGQFYNKQHFKGIIGLIILLLTIHYDHNSWLIYIIYLLLALDAYLISRHYRKLNNQGLFIYVDNK
ncbi:hypothetical protein PRVXT_000219 [Proteinivorax tanatarense]|uniref:TM2 domain-containing protein n=1 Tax=Proteinivorax tanatarense TaxID=1260629 RepID=A0AAU7VMC1_9FIRM